MKNFEKQKGIAFFIIYYSHKNLFYYLTLEQLLVFWNRAKEGGRKSFRFDELDPKFEIPKKQGIFVPYLDTLNKDLEQREERQKYKSRNWKNKENIRYKERQEKENRLVFPERNV